MFIKYELEELELAIATGDLEHPTSVGLSRKLNGRRPSDGGRGGMHMHHWHQRPNR